MGCSLDLEEEAKTLPKTIGVIIPTFNRVDALITCLEHLERQTYTDFEVVVVDDGSTDSTKERIQEFRARTHLRLRYFFQENSGPARARNVAASLLDAPICLMLGDDIFPSPDLVKVHRELHRRRPELDVVGVGLTRWSESGQNVTKFMRWLDSSGVQFSYGELLNGVQPDWRHFYTSNLSMKTEFLLRFPFNEAFKAAAMEDIELGYRLQVQHGFELVFLREALAYHLHPTNFRQACKRMFGVGASTHLFHELWPEQKPVPYTGSFFGRIARKLSRNRSVIALVTAPTHVLTQYCCPSGLLIRVLFMHSKMGYCSRQSNCENLHASDPKNRVISES
jgi:glycosyltransferase involved in cell wall biosynthesis